jgi:hypothetical protein
MIGCLAFLFFSGHAIPALLHSFEGQACPTERNPLGFELLDRILKFFIRRLVSRMCMELVFSGRTVPGLTHFFDLNVIKTQCWKSIFNARHSLIRGEPIAGFLDASHRSDALQTAALAGSHR